MECLSGVVLLMAALGTSAPEGGEEVGVLARLEEAYGGARLRRLRSVRIESDRRLAWPGQGQSAEFVEYATDRMIKYFDLRRRRGSVERWTHQNGNVYHHRYIVDGDGEVTADYSEMTFTRNEEGSFSGSFSPDYRGSDLLLAHALVRDGPEPVYAGKRFYDGRKHDLLSFRVAPETPLLTAYVGSDGLIRRVAMTREMGEVNILFAKHDRRKGVAFATETRTYLDGVLVEYSAELTTDPNPRRGEPLAISSRLRPARTLVDTSSMTVDRLGSGLFHVGQEDYSLFVEHEGAYFVVNTSAGLKARYEALVAYTQRPWPLTKAIATHHHRDHMDGIDDAIALGATLYLTSTTKKVLMRKYDEKAAPPDIVELRDGQLLGPLTIYVRPTSHAVENAFVFHRPEKVLFQDDHYHGRFSTGPSWAQPTAVMLHALIGTLGLDVEALLSGHARKTEPRRLFEAAVRRSRPQNRCPSGRRICR